MLTRKKAHTGLMGEMVSCLKGGQRKFGIFSEGDKYERVKSLEDGRYENTRGN